MGQKTVAIRIEVDRETDNDLSEWSDFEERSKRRHVAIVLRKLTTLRKTHPGELLKLGLLDHFTKPAA